jgi:hypothetical protein
MAPWPGRVEACYAEMEGAREVWMMGLFMNLTTTRQHCSYNFEVVADFEVLGT